MATVNSFPQEQYQYCQDANGDVYCGIVSISGADIEQINVACFLDGDFTNKQIKLTLESTSNGSRVFELWNKDINVTGQNFHYVSFVAGNFHAKDNDTYKVTLSMVPDVNAKIYAIADFTPANNTNTAPLYIPAARLEVYQK